MGIFFKSSNLLSPETWNTGTDSVGAFVYSGTLAENNRANGTDPYGNTSILWECLSDADGGSNGGIAYAGPFNVDNKKLYRFSVWVKRTSSTTTGTFYFGLDQCCSSNVVKNFAGSTDTNPYFDCTSIGNLVQDVWYLFVAHVWPATEYVTNDFVNIVTGSMHFNSGRYIINGQKNAVLAGCNSGDYIWLSSTTSTYFRSFMYYSTNASDKIILFRPMVQVCDGSEGTVENLLVDSSYSTKLGSRSVSYEGASQYNQNVKATGGNVTYSGQWKIHTFTGSSTFNMLSYSGAPPYAEILVVAGGGGTGYDVGGGGGGGGVLTGYTYLTGRTYTITVGGGGSSGQTSGTRGSSGSDSGISTSGGVGPAMTVTATGGGGGGAYNTNTSGLNGGSGGGGGNPSGTAGSGTTGQGFSGGAGASGSYGGGGGGGAGGTGEAGIANQSVNGGAPRFVGISGRGYYYSGGGYGNSDSAVIYPTGLDKNGVSIGRFGFGANGTGFPNNSPYNGEAGIVIIRYRYR